MSKVTVTRYHDISCGHRVVGQGGKCEHLHGHNYRVHFTLTLRDGESLDKVGRVLDFSAIKDSLCRYLEDYWDHRFLMWHEDPLAGDLEELDPEGVYLVGFNPTAENMARYLVEGVGQGISQGKPWYVSKVVIEETRKCSASYEVTRG